MTMTTGYQQWPYEATCLLAMSTGYDWLAMTGNDLLITDLPATTGLYWWWPYIWKWPFGKDPAMTVKDQLTLWGCESLTRPPVPYRTYHHTVLDMACFDGDSAGMRWRWFRYVGTWGPSPFYQPVMMKTFCIKDLYFVCGDMWSARRLDTRLDPGKTASFHFFLLKKTLF